MGVSRANAFNAEFTNHQKNFSVFLAQKSNLSNEIAEVLKSCCNTGVDILQKLSKNAQGGTNSAQAIFPEFPQLSDFTA